MLKNPYIQLFIITLLLTIISYLFEINSLSKNNLINIKLDINKVLKRENSIFYLFVARYLHYLMLVYFAFYLLIFKEKGIDAIVYIILAIVLSYSWIIFDCCIISYYELLFYEENHKDYLTNFHPCLFVVFGHYQAIPLYITGILMFFTFFYLLTKLKNIQLLYRILMGCIFLSLFTYNVITTRYYDTKLQYPIDENHRLYKYFSFFEKNERKHEE